MNGSLCRHLAIAIIFLTSTSCSRYFVSLNDRVVYTPSGLFSEYHLLDPGLQQCVRETITALGLTQAEQLRRLFCPPGKIQHLAGIEVFDRLEYLGLAGNAIEDISALTGLTRLKQVNLADNAISDFALLQELHALSFIDASANANANCLSFTALRHIAELKIPEHC